MAESEQRRLSFSELHRQLEEIAAALQSDERRLQEAEQRVRFVASGEEHPAEEQDERDES